jgi:hypothetical protein
VWLRKFETKRMSYDFRCYPGTRWALGVAATSSLGVPGVAESLEVQFER